MSDSAVLIWFGCVCNESGGVIGAGSVCIQLYIQVSVPTRLFLLHLNHSSHLNIPKMYYGCLHTPPVTWSAYNRTGFSLILRRNRTSTVEAVEEETQVYRLWTWSNDGPDRRTRYQIFFGGWRSGIGNKTNQVEWRNATKAVKLGAAGFGGVQNVVWFKARGQEAHGVRLRRRGDPRHLSPRGALIIMGWHISKVPVFTRSCLNCALVMSSNNSKVAIMWHSHYAQLRKGHTWKYSYSQIIYESNLYLHKDVFIYQHHYHYIYHDAF